MAVFIFDVVFQQLFRFFNIGLNNEGVSFGMGQEIGRVVSLIAFSIFFVWIVYEKRRYNRIKSSLIIIAFGGLGNMVGRLLGGSVWDYICIPFVPFCFNLSDVLIFVGVLTYILGVDGNRSSIRG